MNEHDYLFDKSGPRDPEVARLEHLLGRFRHDADRPAPSARRRLPLAVPLLLAAAVALVTLGWWATRADESVDLMRSDGARVARDVWIEARGEAEHLTMPDVGWLTLAPGGRLRVRRLDREQGHLWLEQGRLEAFVLPSVRPRFFRVETTATTCVDLGCKYVLDVDPSSQRAHVRVTLGKVAFTDDGREVYVPRDAECTAEPGRRVGTPRFVDCPPELRRFLDEFDAAREPQDRRAAALALAGASMGVRDTLPLWHLLADDDSEVRQSARQALVRLVGSAPLEDTLVAWREHLEPNWR
ncbi:MAG: hypothetical protein R3F56_07425 [Planctomycetota bacterium]